MTTPFEHLKSKRYQHATITNEDGSMLYVIEIIGSRVRVGVVNPRGDDMSFVVERSNLKEFAGALEQLLGDIGERTRGVLG